MARRVPDDDLLERIAEAIRDLGGEPLAAPCRGHELPPKRDAHVAAYTCGCGGTVRARLPYRSEDGETHHVTFCVVCDQGHLFPNVARLAYG